MDMLNAFVFQLTVAERAGVTLVFFLCLSGFVLLVRRIFGGKSFHIRIFGSAFEFKGGQPHGSTVFRYIGPETLVEVYNRTVVMSGMTNTLKSKQILYEQMNYLEDKAVIVREAFITAYRRCLSDQHRAAVSDGATVVSSKEYQFFRSLVTLMIEDQKKICRQIFVQNNFSSMAERELQEYLEEKITLLQTKARLYVRELYPSDKMDVPYELVESEVFGKVADAMAKNYDQVFRRAATVYRMRHDEADALESNLRLYLKTMYGADVGGPSNSLGRSLPDQGITSPTARRNNSRSGGYT